MKRLAIAFVVWVGTWALSWGQAYGQLGSYSRPQVNPYPTVSPYVSMFAGRSAAANFFGVVRPQMQTAQTIQHLQQQYQALQDNLNQLGEGGLGGQENMPTTGHPITFLNYSSYFPLMGARFGGGGGSTGNPTGTASFFRR